MQIFAVTLFVSASLLFMVQPMIGKMILPMYGGTPAVWNTCMLFFQAALLGGYAYAHASIAWLGVRKQAALHLVILLLPLALLPIVISNDTPPPTDVYPAFWLLWQLLLRVGLPFFVVSASAPLLQRWFASTNDPAAKDPYFLYAASNAGSLLALLSYPIILEPIFALHEQSATWTTGYVVMVVMIGLCSVKVWRSAAAATTTTGAGTPLTQSATGPRFRGKALNAPTSAVESAVTARQRLWWVFTAFVPSALMLAVTAHITTNLAAIPLLWVIPLALYLLTFILVFARKPIFSQAAVSRAFPFILLPLAVFAVVDFQELGWSMILIHLLLFFTVAMLCHTRLAGSRPSPKHLTEFYLWMSVGGVLGGLFNAIIAPQVFDTILEYPLCIVLACLVRSPRTSSGGARFVWRDVVMPLILGCVLALIVVGLRFIQHDIKTLGIGLLLAPGALACFAFKERPLRFALGYAVLLISLWSYLDSASGRTIHVERNFFGVKRVVLSPDGKFQSLVHGNTNHGMQSTDPDHRDDPLSYYHRSGPIGEVFEVFHNSHLRREVAIVGLGAGSMATYCRAGESFTFYEIDPGVERIARDPKCFTFLQHSPCDAEVIIGDGRLALQQAPNHHFGLIIIDAFSSDSIPTHLLTVEAIELYISKLADGGMLALHISNQYLNLQPLIGNLAHALDLAVIAKDDGDVTAEQRSMGKTSSQYAVIARKPPDFGALMQYPGWKTLTHNADVGTWTDQYSNIFSLFKWD